MAQARKKPTPRKANQKKAASASQPSLWQRYPSLWMAGGIFLLTLLVYGPTVSYDYTFDDDIYTRKNRVTQKGLSGLGEIFGKGSVYGFNNENSGTYRPVTLLSFALERSVHGRFKAPTSHRWNLFLHALALGLLMLVLLRWFPDIPKWLLAATGLLYLLHPVHVEVGASVKSRDEILALIGVLGATLFLLTYVKSEKTIHLIGAVLTYFLACMAKENAIMWGAVAPLILWQQQVPRKRWLKLAGILAIGGAAYLALRLIVLDPSTANPPADPFINNSLLAASSFSERTASHSYLLGYYLKLLVWPHPLRIDYSFQQLPLVPWAHPGAWGSMWAYLAIIGFIASGLMFRRIWAVGLTWLLLFLLPVSHLLVPIGATLAERFLFLPSLGFCLSVGFGFYAIQQRFLPKSPNWLLPAIMGILILAAGWQSRRHIPFWENNDTLFTYGVESSPKSFRTHLNLAEITRARAEASRDPQSRQRDFQTSVEHYVESLRIYNGQANTWYNLGVSYAGLGRAEQAQQSYLSALKISPTHARANNNAGVYYFQRADYASARPYFETAIAAQPGFVDAIANLGATYHNQGQANQALTYYQQALDVQPNNGPVLRNMAQLYRQLGDEAKAAELMQRAGQ